MKKWTFLAVDQLLRILVGLEVIMWPFREAPICGDNPLCVTTPEESWLMALSFLYIVPGLAAFMICLTVATTRIAAGRTVGFPLSSAFILQSVSIAPLAALMLSSFSEPLTTGVLTILDALLAEGAPFWITFYTFTFAPSLLAILWWKLGHPRKSTVGANRKPSPSTTAS